MARVLLCDDAGFVREILSQAVRELGHEVIGEARDGFEVIDRAVQLKPDVILMDLVLPLKNGAEAAMDIRRMLPGIKIVAISTVDEEFLKRKALDTGCDAYISKPFTKAQLKLVFSQLGSGQSEVKSG